MENELTPVYRDKFSKVHGIKYRKLSVMGISSGIGNLLGFNLANFNVDYLIDDRDFILKSESVFRHNFPKLQMSKYISDAFLDTESVVIVSSPSCAQISALGNRRADRQLLDKLSLKEFEFFRIVDAVFKRKARVYLIEYLPSLLKHMNVTHEGLYREQTDEFYAWPKHFKVQIMKLNALSYGVPQNRKRLFILLSHPALNFHYVPPVEYTLSLNKVGPVLEDIYKEESLLDHETPEHSQDRIEGFSKLRVGESYYGGQNNKRLDPNKFAPVIASHCTQHVHPWESRVLTPREVATFQGFPLDFSFGNVSTSLKLDLIGKTIPPPITKHIGLELKRAIKSYSLSKGIEHDIILPKYDDLY